MSLKNMLSKTSQANRVHTVWFHVYTTEGKTNATQSEEHRWGRGGPCGKGTREPCGVMDMFSILAVVAATVERVCICQDDRTVHLKGEFSCFYSKPQ